MAGGVCSAGRTTLFKSPTLFDAFFLARLLHIVLEVRSLFEKWNKNVYPEFLIGLKKYLTNETFFLNEVGQIRNGKIFYCLFWYIITYKTKLNNYLNIKMLKTIIKSGKK